MRKSDWKREYRRVRCGSWQVDPKVAAAYLNRTSHWEACTIIRATWLARDTMRAHKLTLIGDCRRALRLIRPQLP
jgi:hypothetical protein